ncbi:Uncharacterized protein TCAP_07398 [Tolypocladium capitatum]|uniref:Chromo domain-containing protein n=1 Tax=Tolypocladium capitatum TaxID=45235 RepID=A0A2K3PYX7_9HYPO|nr:Uncharacterized protein TCAP_07398 [Tolypocladium capitatum]
MPPASRITVSLRHKPRVDREEAERLVADWAHLSIRPSIERRLGSPEDLPIKTSDIVRSDYVAYDETDDYSETKGNKEALSVSSRVSRSNGQCQRPSKLTTPRRKRQGIWETFPRRSSRIQAVTAANPTAKTAPTKPKNRVAKKSLSTPSRSAGGEWEIDEIVDSRIEEETLKHFYLVKWTGFASEDNTWEPKTNLVHCRAAIEAYEMGAK